MIPWWLGLMGFIAGASFGLLLAGLVQASAIADAREVDRHPSAGNGRGTGS